MVPDQVLGAGKALRKDIIEAVGGKGGLNAHGSIESWLAFEWPGLEFGCQARAN